MFARPLCSTCRPTLSSSSVLVIARPPIVRTSTPLGSTLRCRPRRRASSSRAPRRSPGPRAPAPGVRSRVGGSGSRRGLGGEPDLPRRGLPAAAAAAASDPGGSRRSAVTRRLISSIASPWRRKPYWRSCSSSNRASSCLPAVVVEVAVRQRHLELVVLAGIAQVGRPANRDLLGVDVPPQLGHRLVVKLPLGAREIADAHAGGVSVRRAHPVDPRLRDRRAEGRAQPGVGRHQHGRHVEALRDGAGVERPGAPERDQDEVARVEAALDRDQPDRVRHVLVGGADRGEGRGFRGQVELGAEPGEGGAGRVGVEWHRAAEEVPRVEPPERQVGVGQGRLRAARTVRDRARHRPRAPRPDVQQAALVDPRDRAAARSDRADGDAGDADRDAPRDLELARVLLLALEHEADVAARAAHVERERGRAARCRREEAGADDTAGEPRQEQAAGAAPGLLGAQVAAVRREQVPALDARVLPDHRPHAVDVDLDQRLDVRVGDRRARPLVLAPDRRDLVRDGDRQVGRDLPDRVCDRLLVRRVEVREQARHGDDRAVAGQRAELLAQLLERRRLEVLDDLAFVVDAAGDGQAVAAQRRAASACASGGCRAAPCRGGR